MLGDSITHLWDNKDAVAARAKYFAAYKIFNLGIGGDRTQNTIQLLTDSGIPELLNPKLVTLMIGTNNSTRNDYRATVAGVKKILELISGRYPDATILLYAIFPRGKDNSDVKRMENQKVNAEIVKFCDGKKIIWVDINKEFLTPEGVLERSVMKDLLHLSPKGFEIWGKSLQTYFEKYGK
jgi:beta-glucosidase